MKNTDISTELTRYERKPSLITAVQLNLDTTGFQYSKWGDNQTCKPGDWLVLSGTSTYTIDKESFSKTYTEVSPGRYQKKCVWARRAVSEGVIRTKEGNSHYNCGDILMFNNADETDGYCISFEKFENLYVIPTR